ncbi:MAG: polysaccharide pyruvyl transferase family protein [Oscillospiraceae bacterium]|nr:polysaccharide pyruvyl transferase family protein [Oscillospiraceae bacterium]
MIGNTEFKSFGAYLIYRLKEKKHNQVYVYGIGLYAKMVCELFRENDIKVIALLDEGYGRSKYIAEMNLPVCSISEIENRPIVIASKDYQEEIFARLIKQGVSEDRLFKIFTHADLFYGEKSLDDIFSKCPKPTAGDMNTIVFVGDNSDYLNFGCRATSMALSDILSETTTISERISRGDILGLFSAIPICDDWGVYISTIKKYNCTIFEKLVNSIKKADAVVFNGEGSFILKSPPRVDLHNYLVVMLACIEADKPFFVLNFMFSAFSSEPLNNDLSKTCLQAFGKAEIICVRDNESKRLIESENNSINVKYLPDALFSWYNLLTNNAEKLKCVADNYQFSLPFISDERFYRELDLSQRYILLSGNSYASHFPNLMEKSFFKLAVALRDKAEALGCKLYLIECCGGDFPLRKVAIDVGVPLIPANINIYFAMYILSSAQCFVSGRYHPSIMASLGGTPCVFMGSNSHKTTSLQDVLEYSVIKTFNPLPDDEEIDMIVEETIAKINADRELIQRNSEKNCLLTEEIFKKINY